MATSHTTERGNLNTRQTSLAGLAVTAFLEDNAHIQITAPNGRTQRHSLHIGLYEPSNITLYASTAALQELRDAITAHIDAIPEA